MLCWCGSLMPSVHRQNNISCIFFQIQVLDKSVCGRPASLMSHWRVVEKYHKYLMYSLWTYKYACARSEIKRTEAPYRGLCQTSYINKVQSNNLRHPYQVGDLLKTGYACWFFQCLSQLFAVVEDLKSVKQTRFQLEKIKEFVPFTSNKIGEGESKSGGKLPLSIWRWKQMQKQLAFTFKYPKAAFIHFPFYLFTFTIAHWCSVETSPNYSNKSMIIFFNLFMNFAQISKAC